MTTMKQYNRDMLMKLREVLKSSCHAPGCVRNNNCPRQCGCNRRRDFKLNTETAMCWDIGDMIFEMLRGNSRPLMSERRQLIISTKAFDRLTRFHMTKGWQNFFCDVAKCIKEHCEPSHYSYKLWIKEEGYIDELETRLNRLKRYPR